MSERPDLISADHPRERAHRLGLPEQRLPDLRLQRLEVERHRRIDHRVRHVMRSGEPLDHVVARDVASAAGEALYLDEQIERLARHQFPREEAMRKMERLVERIRREAAPRAAGRVRGPFREDDPGTPEIRFVDLEQRVLLFELRHVLEQRRKRVRLGLAEDGARHAMAERQELRFDVEMVGAVEVPEERDDLALGIEQRFDQLLRFWQQLLRLVQRRGAIPERELQHALAGERPTARRRAPRGARAHRSARSCRRPVSPQTIRFRPACIASEAITIWSSIAKAGGTSFCWMRGGQVALGPFFQHTGGRSSFRHGLHTRTSHASGTRQPIRSAIGIGAGVLTVFDVPRRAQCGAVSAVLLTKAMRLLSGDHDGTLIDPCPPNM